MADSRDDSIDPDRAAILARRSRFISRAIEALERPSLVGSRTKLVALAVSGLTTACPCLKMSPPPDDESSGDSAEGNSNSTTGDSTDGATEPGDSEATSDAGETTVS